ncbi:MAG: family 16 glycosylhydrolase [Spirochaetales bacterium]|nr:family 16 glycosylhydrolase [Spirochaetales bacterium]
MKKKYTLLVLILLILYSGGGLYSQALGDVNNDSGIDIVDGLLIAQYYVGLHPVNFNPDAADVDANSSIDIVDALLIAQYYVGLITEFPGQTQTALPTAPPLDTPAPTSVPTTPPTGNTIVVNGDFETGNLSPWGAWNNARIADWKSYSGSYSGAVGSAPASLEQTITIEPNSLYELGGYLLVDTNGEEVNLGVKNYGGNELSRVVTQNSFTYRSLRFTTNDYSTTATIYIYKSSGSGWGYGDDIRVTKIGSVGSGPQPPAIPGNWQLVFQDEFDGNQLDTSKWSTDYPWGHTHNHRAYTDPANVRVENGLLRIMAENRRHPDAPDGIRRDDFGWLSLDYTSGCVTTSGKFHTDHGYMEARLKLPPTKGFWPAFWTLGDGWPPEIDILEFLSSVQTRFYTNYHWSIPQSGSHFVEHNGVDLTNNFHVFAVEWDSSHMTWYFDGSEIARYTGSNCSQAVNQYILLNLAVGGWEADPDSTTSWPGVYECDWVRVWQK